MIMRQCQCVLMIFASFLARGSLQAGSPQDAERKLVLQAPPATSVNSVAVAPDGSLVATAAGEGGVRLYSAKTGRLLRVLGDVGDRSVVFSPDGRHLSAAGFHMDKLVGVYEVSSGKRVLALAGHKEWEADATAISPNGKFLASTGTDKQILVWDLATGKLVHQLADQPARMAALAFSPDSSILATGGGDRVVRLWDLSSGKVRGLLSGHRDWICTLAFSPDGKTLASGSCDWGFHRGHDWPRPAERGQEKSEWRLWDVAAQKLIRTETLEGPLLSLAFAPDGETLATASADKVRLYDLASPASSRVLTIHDAGATSVAFTPDGSAVVSGSHDQTVKRTNLKTGKTEWQAPGSFEQVNSVALSADRSLLVTGSSDHRFARLKLAPGASHAGPGAVRLWDLTTARLLHTLGDPGEQILAVAISPDGRRIASGGASTKGRGTVRAWDAATGELLWSKTDHEKEVLSFAFSADGSLVASGSTDGLVNVYDAATGKLSRSLPGHQGGATAVAFSPETSLVICGEGYGGVRAWKLNPGLAYTCPGADARAKVFTIDRLMNSIGLSADGRLLATCASSVNNEFVDSVKLWEARTGTLLRDFSAENIHGRPMALSPDGSLLATGGKSVKLWDVRTGKQVRELFGNLKRTQSIVFSADAQLVVSGGSYGTVNLWATDSGKHLLTLFAFPRDANEAATHDWLAYTPDGFFNGSPAAGKYVAWRTGDELETSPDIIAQFRQPEKVGQANAVGSAR